MQKLITASEELPNTKVLTDRLKRDMQFDAKYKFFFKLHNPNIGYEILSLVIEERMPYDHPALIFTVNEDVHGVSGARVAFFMDKEGAEKALNMVREFDLDVSTPIMPV